MILISIIGNISTQLLKLDGINKTQIKVILVRPNAKCDKLGQEIAPYNEVIDLVTQDHNVLADEIISAANRHKCDGIKIISCVEDSMDMVGKLNEKLKTGGPGVQEIDAFRNKMKMKILAMKAGIRTPEYYDLGQEKNISAAYGIIRYAIQKHGIVILKPKTGQSSKDVVAIKKIEQLSNIGLFNNHFRDFEVEQYIDGILYHIDAITINGEIKFSSAHRYNVPCLEFLNGKNLGSIPVLEEHKNERLIEFNKQVLSAFPGYDKVTHLEVFSSKNDLYFLEIAARPAGGPVRQMIYAMYNIDIFEEAIAIQSSQENRSYSGLKKKLAGGYIFPKKNGLVEHINSPKLKSDFEFKTRVETGERTQASQSLSDKFGELIFTSTDIETIEEDFSNLGCFQVCKMIGV